MSELIGFQKNKTKEQKNPNLTAFWLCSFPEVRHKNYLIKDQQNEETC